jgi:hypothetical protein
LVAAWTLGAGTEDGLDAERLCALGLVPLSGLLSNVLDHIGEVRNRFFIVGV